MFECSQLGVSLRPKACLIFCKGSIGICSGVLTSLFLEGGEKVIVVLVGIVIGVLLRFRAKVADAVAIGRKEAVSGRVQAFGGPGDYKPVDSFVEQFGPGKFLEVVGSDVEPVSEAGVIHVQKGLGIDRVCYDLVSKGVGDGVVKMFALVVDLLVDFASLLVNYGGVDRVDGLAASYGDGSVGGLVDGEAALFKAMNARVPKFNVVLVVFEELIERIGDFCNEVEKGKLFLI